MGSAIVHGMLDSGKFKADNIQVVLPKDSPHYDMVKSDLGLKVWEEYPQEHEFDVILFGVKPQILPEILPHYGEIITNQNALIISIAAGKTLSYFEHFLPNHPVVRVMPNINVTVKEGATAGIKNSLVTDSQAKVVSDIFETLGYFMWLESEDLMDVVVAVSGSSPAYYFLFTEYLASLAEARGMNHEDALKLAEASFVGSAIMKKQSGKSLQDLRAMVTSHKGTTFEAITEFEKDQKLYKTIEASFDAAIRRSKELSE